MPFDLGDDAALSLPALRLVVEILEDALCGRQGRDESAVDDQIDEPADGGGASTEDRAADRTTNGGFDQTENESGPRHLEAKAKERRKEVSARSVLRRAEGVQTTPFGRGTR